jgi:hypothetical protein
MSSQADTGSPAGIAEASVSTLRVAQRKRNPASTGITETPRRQCQKKKMKQSMIQLKIADATMQVDVTLPMPHSIHSPSPLDGQGNTDPGIRHIPCRFYNIYWTGPIVCTARRPRGWGTVTLIGPTPRQTGLPHAWPEWSPE